MAKLTKRMIDTLKPAAQEVTLWDDQVKGFGLRLWPSGRKVFILMYRNRQGRLRKITLGEYGRLTVEEARRLARQTLADVAKGQDPAEDKQERRKALTVADLAERYIHEYAEPHKKPFSVFRDRQLIERFIVPALGRHKIAGVTRADVARLHHDVRNTPIQANRTLAVLSKMFSQAVLWGLRPDNVNPVKGITRFKENKRTRFLSGEELARVGQALQEAEKTEHPSALLMLRLLLFTGARLSEIMTLKWNYVNLERGALDLPDSKTGAKIIPLSGPALEALSNAPRLAGNPYVCPGLKEGLYFVDIHHVWERIRTRTGLSDVRIHDLRHSFASVAAAANMGLPLIGKLLGHTQAATTQRYAHLDLDPLRAAADEVARRIDEAMRQPVKSKVVPFRPR
ncbi:MAG: site-specific integrase [Thermodesulfobacteriota bacterium]